MPARWGCGAGESGRCHCRRAARPALPRLWRSDAGGSGPVLGWEATSSGRARPAFQMEQQPCFPPLKVGVTLKTPHLLPGGGGETRRFSVHPIPSNSDATGMMARGSIFTPLYTVRRLASPGLDHLVVVVFLTGGFPYRIKCRNPSPFLVFKNENRRGGSILSGCVSVCKAFSPHRISMLTPTCSLKWYSLGTTGPLGSVG